MNSQNTPGSLRQRNKERTRDAILDATAELLTDHDIAVVLVDEIAERSQVSRATVFNYFPTKTDIVLGIAEREITALREYSLTAGDGGTPPLDIIGEAMYRLAKASFEAGPAGWQIMRTLLEKPERSDSPVWDFLDLIEGLLKQAASMGEVSSNANVTECARIVFGALIVEMFAAAGDRRSRTLDRADFDRIADTLLCGFGTERKAFT